MKKLINIVLCGSAFLMFSCSDKFLEEKRDLTGQNEQVFQDSVLAQAYVDYVYSLFLPGNGAASFVVNQTAANGNFSDLYTKTTDELAGQTDLNRDWGTIAINQNHAHQYFGQRMTASIANNTWTRLKQINIFVAEIDKHGLPESARNKLKGQMLFWRAYQYFELLRLYGGVPLVLEPQNPIGAEGSDELKVQRSSSTETLQQIVKDLDEAVSLLPGKYPNSGTDWGRITSGGAAAFKGRVLLTWASPLFNRNDDVARWQAAYDANLAAKTLLESNGYGLYNAGGFNNGTAWENMWFKEVDNMEGVFVFMFNNVTSDQSRRNNGWEQAARSRQINGGGSISPTKQIVDAFPMKNGKKITDPTSTYDPKKFYKNRDPRFYKTFTYNGAVWPYSGNSTFRQWTYSWHTTAAQPVPNAYTEANPNSSGIYVRKATSPSASNSNGDFTASGTDFMELRFAEVILNLAESAIGINKLSEGLDLIKLIRQRAGLEAGDGNYGLTDAVGNRDKMFAAVIDERKIEFAYEGKRFWDLRRWMLFNNDFGTCTRLGMQPINGTRRTGYWIYAKKGDGTKYVASSGTANDPFLRKANNTVPVIDREPLVLPPGFANYDAYLDHLYDNYFEIIERDNLDPTNPAGWTFKWYNEYYFFGLHQSILTVSPYLQQTKGWPDFYGGTGTFDPLQ